MREAVRNRFSRTVILPSASGPVRTCAPSVSRQTGMRVRFWMKFTIRSRSSIFVCDRLRRSSEVPARSSQWMTLSLRDAGPNVHRSSISLTFMTFTLASI